MTHLASSNRMILRIRACANIGFYLFNICRARHILGLAFDIVKSGRFHDLRHQLRAAQQGLHIPLIFQECRIDRRRITRLCTFQPKRAAALGPHDSNMATIAMPPTELTPMVIHHRPHKDERNIGRGLRPVRIKKTAALRHIRRKHAFTIFLIAKALRYLAKVPEE